MRLDPNGVGREQSRCQGPEGEGETNRVSQEERNAVLWHFGEEQLLVWEAFRLAGEEVNRRLELAARRGTCTVALGSDYRSAIAAGNLEWAADDC